MAAPTVGHGQLMARRVAPLTGPVVWWHIGDLILVKFVAFAARTTSQVLLGQVFAMIKVDAVGAMLLVGGRKGF